MSVPGNGKGILVALVAHSLSLIGLFGWLLSISFYAGEKSHELYENTKQIEDLKMNGTMGTKPRLDNLEQQVMELKRENERLREMIEKIK